MWLTSEDLPGFESRRLTCATVQHCCAGLVIPYKYKITDPSKGVLVVSLKYNRSLSKGGIPTVQTVHERESAKAMYPILEGRI